MQLREVTPQVASAWLLLNTSNRRLRPAAVKRFVDVMLQGRFRGQAAPPITISWDGVLLDGQHRLQAVVDSGTTQMMYLRQNADPEDFNVIDNGGAGLRQASDLLSHAGIGNGTQLAASAGLVFGYDNHPDSVWSVSNRQMMQDAVDMVKSNATEYGAAIALAKKVQTQAKVHLSSYIALTFIVARESETIEQFVQFTEAVSGGELLTSDMPAFVLRRWNMQRLSQPQSSQASFIAAIKAWNAHRNGIALTRLVTRGGTGKASVALPVPVILPSLY